MKPGTLIREQGLRAAGGGEQRPLRVLWENPDARVLLARGAHALWVDGDRRHGRQLFESAYLMAQQDGDGQTMAQAALGMAGLWAGEHRHIATAAVAEDRLRRALATVAPESLLGLRLRVRLAGEAEILSLVRETRLAGDPVAHAEALSLAHHRLLGPEHGDERLGIARELIAVSGRTGRRSDVLMGLLWWAVDSLLNADPHAPRYVAELRAQIEEHPHLAVDYVAQAIDVMLEIRAGRWDQAESRAKACHDAGSAAGDADALGWFGAHMVAIRWFQGRMGELVAMLEDMVASPTLSVIDHSHLAALAVAHAGAGDRRQALGALARLRGRGLAALPRSGTWLVTLCAVVEAAYLLDEPRYAEEASRLLLPHAHLPMIAGPGVACFGSVRHALGLAALTTGSIAEAIEHLRAAVFDNIAIGNWPAATLSRARLAVALDRAGDAEAAAQSRLEGEIARREADELGVRIPAATPGDRLSIAVEVSQGRPTCTRFGGFWRVTWRERAVQVRRCVGMAYLAVLLANPGHEIPAAELMMGAGARPQGDATADAGPEWLAPQPVLDQEAVQRYRARLTVLQAEIDRCDASGDQRRGTEAHAEREWLLKELRAASGLPGRVRSFATSDERARVAVRKAIHRALERITAADTVLGQELSASVHTGNRCSFTP